jgi:propanol-preferring alcohol dehydrogenase
MITTAAQLIGPQQAVLVQPAEVASPGPGEVLVRMQACGICHSDVFVSSLPQLPLVPLTLGHEGIGVVVEAGAGVDNVRTGDRVGITYFASSCGECEYCKSGRERLCPKQKNSGYSAHGALTNYAVVSAQQLIKVPLQLDAVKAAPLCCAGWTAYGALQNASLQEGQTVAIFGFGGLGNYALQFALHRKLRPIVSDVSEEKLETARALGAAATFLSDGAGRRIVKEAGGAHAAIVFTGSGPAIEQAFRSLKRAGTLVLVGLGADAFPLPVTEAIQKAIRIQASYLGTRQDLETIFRLAAEDSIQIPTTPRSLEEVPATLQQLKAGEIQGRAVVSFPA